MPYKLEDNAVYLFSRRGDIGNPDPDIVGWRDGMVGWIDVRDWFGVEVWLSDFTMKRMFIAKCPRGWKTSLMSKSVGGKDSANHDMPVVAYIDYASFSSLKTVDGQTIVNPETLIHSPVINPVWDFQNESSTVLKDGTARDWKNTAAIPDFHAITAGSYTVGSGADDYPTWGGAGGARADVNNLTGNLTITGSTSTTEPGTATVNNKTIGTYTFTCDGNSGHAGDPTAGLITTVTGAGINFWYNRACRSNGGGVTITKDFNIIANTGGGNVTNLVLCSQPSLDVGDYEYEDMLINGNANATYVVDCVLGDASSSTKWKNINAWDGTHGSGNVYFESTKGTNTLENVNSFDAGGHGFNFASVTGTTTLNNCTSCDNGSNDFNGIGSLAGNNNSSSDATAANANWSTGTGNIFNQVTANCVEGTNDGTSNFFDITPYGPWDGTGTTNTLPRPFGIRGRPVPGPRGTSMGVAELPEVAGGPAKMRYFRNRRT